MKTALITGTSRGIGRDLALTLAGRGWDVVGTLRSDEGRAELEAAGVDVVTVDVTDRASVEAAVFHTVTHHGSLDLLVANAGVGLFGCFEDVDPEQIRRVFEVNFFGVLACTRAALPHLRASAGRIVVISSIAGRRSAPGSSAYNASKFAVEGWAEGLRHELAETGVGLTLVQPGPIATGFFEQRVAGPRSGRGTYAAITQRVRELQDQALQKAAPPSTVTRVVLDVLDEKHPPPFRVAVGGGTAAQLTVVKLLPWMLWEKLVAWRIGVGS